MQDNYVKIKMFTWAMGIFILVIAGIFGYIINDIEKVDVACSAYQDHILEIKTQLSAIQTDLVWIKLNIK